MLRSTRDAVPVFGAVVVLALLVHLALMVGCTTSAILRQPKTPEQEACGWYYVECSPPPHWACCAEHETCFVERDGTHSCQAGDSDAPMAARHLDAGDTE